MIKLVRLKKNRYNIVSNVFNYKKANWYSVVRLENVNALEATEYLERVGIPIFYLAPALAALVKRGFKSAYFNKNFELIFLSRS